uniref:Uncharacterized protein n=1 Tax=Acrobeloides nanus TaxID=290746 RepID=A0A914EK84_9BILA
MHKYFENNDPVDPVEYLLVLKNLIEGTIEALENYFESRPKSENNLPTDINRQFNEDLSMLYDMATEHIMDMLNDDSDELDFSS